MSPLQAALETAIAKEAVTALRLPPRIGSMARIFKFEAVSLSISGND